MNSQGAPPNELFLAAFLTAAPITLEADRTKHRAFSVKHMMVTTVRGAFTKFSSTLTFARTTPPRPASC